MNYSMQFSDTAQKLQQTESLGEAEELISTIKSRGWFRDKPETFATLASIAKDRFPYHKPSTTTLTQQAIGTTSMIKLLGLSKLPTKEYVIERFELSRGSFGLLCATGCSGKTMLVQYIACCISSGKPLFGTFPVLQGSVVHIDQEQSQVQTQRRYERLAGGLGIDSLDITRITLANRLDSPKLRIQDVEAELVKALTGKTIAIIDSLKKTSEADENSADIEVVLNMFKQVAETTNCAILLIHHKGKGKDAKQSGRGHSSIYDSVDIQIDLDSNDGIYEIECAKNRDGDFFPGIKYRLVDGGDFNKQQNCSERLDLDLLQADVRSRKSDARSRIVELLGSVESINQGALFAQIKGDRALFQDAITALTDNGEVSKSTGAKGAHIYTLTEKGRAVEGWK